LNTRLSGWPQENVICHSAGDFAGECANACPNAKLARSSCECDTHILAASGFER
jgi:hypothetical protein